MNKDFLERISQLSPKKLALLAMELQSKLESSQNSRSEPIAIVGIGCRFPGGANSPDAYWKMLCEGVDAITEIPKSRWDVDQYYDPDPETPGKMATRWGGFLEGVDQFDPQFFGISPREAISMDPQQRLLLEVAWEALEHAGYSPEDLSGSPTGVFVGICNNDYSQLLLSGETSNIDAYLATGSAFSIASGRISYVLGLQGPSLSVDTACSSSLVATHLAIQSLRNKECQMALAAGVNLILRPEVTITLSQSKMMAADGRCKAFDARADGFVRSEGCGVIVLKLLSHAIADGDNILAVIRGSAMNQDGRSNGITAPNGPSQEAVIQAALADAQVRSDEVGYVETHGTGTSLGDPIEVQALGNVLGAGHSADDPLMIGSVKTNLGHLESAAGVAGLIKLVLALHHQEIPPHLHLHEPNPHIAWKNYPLVIPTKRTP
ncbi:MAG: type I polyketide synthase, partial [Anaerolineales bacterium]